MRQWCRLCLLQNSSTLLVYLSEPVVSVMPFDTGQDDASTAINGSHFSLLLADGSASLTGWSRIDFPSNADRYARRQLAGTGTTGLLQVALHLTIQGTITAAGQMLYVAAQANALADTNGNVMGTEMVPAGSILPGFGLEAQPDAVEALTVGGQETEIPLALLV